MVSRVFIFLVALADDHKSHLLPLQEAEMDLILAVSVPHAFVFFARTAPASIRMVAL